jgi:hypothetical protein
VQPEEPVKYALCRIFQPAGSHPYTRFSSGNLTEHRNVRLRGTPRTKQDGSPHAGCRLVNLRQASARWNVQDAVSIRLEPIGHEHFFFNSNLPPIVGKNTFSRTLIICSLK